MTTEEEFEKWANTTYVMSKRWPWNKIDLDTEASHLAWLETTQRHQKKIERLKEGLDQIPYAEYSNALREGCDENGAWDCFKEACRRHVKILLEET